MEKVALCPGTYDPITEGHKDIIERCAKVFDRIIVAVSRNSRKKPMYSLKQRIEFIERVFANNNKVTVLSFDGLLVDVAKKASAGIIVKGLRAISDFEYEFQMAQMNKKLNSDIESMFLISNPKYSYLSSSLVKEIASFNGCIKGLVPCVLEEDIIKSFKNYK